MGEILVYLAIPAALLLVDYVVSYLRAPSFSIRGLRSSNDRQAKSPSTPSATATPPAPGVFIFALQNNEAAPVEWKGQEARLVLRIRGEGEFDASTPLEISAGPDEELALYWTRPGTELVVSFPRMRPLKTWLFRARVSSSVQEMSITLQIPIVSASRRVFARINEKTFGVPDLDFGQYECVVRDKEDARATRLPPSPDALLWRVFLAVALLATFSYWLFGRIFLTRANELFGSVATLYPSSLLNRLLSWPSLGMDVLVFLVGLVCIFLFARTPPVPVVQGYLEVQAVSYNEIGANIQTPRKFRRAVDPPSSDDTCAR